MNNENLQEVACRSVELHVENPASRRALMTRSNRLSRNKAKMAVTVVSDDSLYLEYVIFLCVYFPLCYSDFFFHYQND